MTDPAPRDPALPARVGIVGCGTVGAAWAALFHAHGVPVAAFDPALADDAALHAAVAPFLPPLRTLGMTGAGALHRVATPEAACEDAGFVQESAPEKVDAKVALLARLDAATPPGAIIASSTSALLWSEITPACTNPARFVVGHPFNPVHLIPLVEIYGIDAAVTARAAALYRALGMRPIVLRREMRGHLANRLSSALYREAVHIVAEGAASVEDVDTVLRDGPAMRWAIAGVHLGYHLGGGRGGIRHYFEHLGPSQQRRWDDLGRPTLDAATVAALIEGVLAAYGDVPIETHEARRDAALLQARLARREAEGDR
jgi:3-hydroxyacyl-CoA dehydrogenase